MRVSLTSKIKEIEEPPGQLQSMLWKKTAEKPEREEPPGQLQWMLWKKTEEKPERGGERD